MIFECFANLLGESNVWGTEGFFCLLRRVCPECLQQYCYPGIRTARFANYKTTWPPLLTYIAQSNHFPKSLSGSHPPPPPINPYQCNLIIISSHFHFSTIKAKGLNGQQLRDLVEFSSGKRCRRQSFWSALWAVVPAGCRGALDFLCAYRNGLLASWPSLPGQSHSHICRASGFRACKWALKVLHLLPLPTSHFSFFLPIPTGGAPIFG